MTIEYDEIIIKDLHLRTIIGVHEWEKEKAQNVIVNLRLMTNTRKAGQSDRIEDTVDYDRLTQRLNDYAESHSFELIETLAEKMAELILTEPYVIKVVLQIDKPKALRFAQRVGVKIAREKAKRK